MGTCKQAELIFALHRDVRWLEARMREIAKASGASADRLREMATNAVETAKRRGKRTRGGDDSQ